MAAPTDDPRPLAGIVVVDLTRVLAGPFCTLTLAHLGARILKVEQPGIGDMARSIPPHVEDRSLYFSAINYDKESIALDLKADADRAVFEALLARADVLVENFRPGAMERLGYGWDVLHARFPRLVYGAASGFGHTGPRADRPAFDMVVQGMSGMMSVTGQPGSPPTRVGMSIGDIAAGLYLTIGIVAALYQRRTTGVGTKVDIGMLDCQLALLAEPFSRYLNTGHVPGPMGSQHPSIAPFAAYRAQDGWLVIAGPTPAQWESACNVLGLPEVATDPRFADMPNRLQHLDALRALFETALAKKPVAEWLAALDAADVPSAPINDLAQAAADPQVEARHMILEMLEPVLGRYRAVGNPIKLSNVPEQTHRPAPPLDGDGPTIRRFADRS